MDTKEVGNYEQDLKQKLDELTMLFTEDFRLWEGC